MRRLFVDPSGRHALLSLQTGSGGLGSLAGGPHLETFYVDGGATPSIGRRQGELLRWRTLSRRGSLTLSLVYQDWYDTSACTLLALSMTWLSPVGVGCRLEEGTAAGQAQGHGCDQRGLVPLHERTQLQVWGSFDQPGHTTCLLICTAGQVSARHRGGLRSTAQLPKRASTPTRSRLCTCLVPTALLCSVRRCWALTLEPSTS